MTLQNAFKVIPELNLIIFSWKGIVTYESWMQQKHKIIAHKDFQLNLKSIEDFRDLTFNVSVEDVKKYIDFAIENENDSQKLAILTSTPNQVTISSLYENLKGDEMGETSIFSTVQATLNWLEIPINKQQIVRDIIAELRNVLVTQS